MNHGVHLCEFFPRAAMKHRMHPGPPFSHSWQHQLRLIACTVQRCQQRRKIIRITIRQHCGLLQCVSRVGSAKVIEWCCMGIKDVVEGNKAPV